MTKTNFPKISTVSQGYIDNLQGKAKKGVQELDKQLHELTMKRFGPDVPFTEAEKKAIEKFPSPVTAVKFEDLAGYIKKA